MSKDGWSLKVGINFLRYCNVASNYCNANVCIGYLKILAHSSSVDGATSETGSTLDVRNVTTDSDVVFLPPSLTRFKFLASKLMIASETPTGLSANPTLSSIQGQLDNYLSELQQYSGDEDALTFWRERRASYAQLADLAEDLITAPASQAYVERIFSLCGLLTAGRRNRLKTNLEMRVFLKLNAHWI